MIVLFEYEVLQRGFEVPSTARTKSRYRYYREDKKEKRKEENDHEGQLQPFYVIE